LPQRANLTDGVLRDVGTLKTSSGKRLNATLTGIDTPTLYGLWESAPYLHDGSAANLTSVINLTSHGNAASLNAVEKAQLVDYLLSLDGSTPGNKL
jgi:cytochrome c peroxidase